MVTTGDIHKAAEELKDAQTGLSKDESDLDDVMLAMDVVKRAVRRRAPSGPGRTT